ncbi:MAG: hypothetical protein E6K94_06725 [Thaumarchaeota archaeon]|nr:MAG: hypothetical protein E6K94_06725 [Nitrososphaerota archaeon]
MLGKSKIAFLLIITVLLIVLICPSNQQVSSQSSGGVVPPQTQIESIKILSLLPNQNVDLEKEPVISGESSDTIAKDCSVYVIVNDVRPYQSAVASGKGGANDFSQWKFVLHKEYAHLNEGSNKITAKLLCKTAPARWNSVVVNGVPSNNASETLSPVESSQQSNASETLSPVESSQQSNASETLSPVESSQQSNASETLSPVESSQQSNASETSLSDNKKVETNNNQLLVTISPQKDPVARGDTQNATITVTDSNHRSIANAQIDGNLIYPGDNFKKQFKGITDYQGKFVYSWTVGKKGDVGPLVIDLQVSSGGYQSTSAKNSFEIVKSDESSEIKNPFQSHFQGP